MTMGLSAVANQNADEREPLVDIGIPSWGRPGYLATAIESVLAQTLGSWRLVVSEDGPAGGPVAAAVAPYLTDRRIRYTVAGESMGAAGNKTQLIQIGRAPYVALLDDDDCWESEFLARRVAFLEAHPECGLVFSSMAVIDGSGREVGRWTAGLAEGMQLRVQFVRRLLRSNPIGSSSTLVRRSAYEAVGPVFDGRFPRTYDYEMWLRLGLRFPVGYLGGYDACWRVHTDQGSAELGGLVEEYSALVDHMFALAQRDQPDLGLSDRERRQKLSSILLTGALNALEHGDRRTSADCLRTALRIHPLAIAD